MTTNNLHAHTDTGMSTDTAGAAFFDYLIDAVEQYTTENNLPWFSALGAISLLDTHLKNLMMSE